MEMVPASTLVAPLPGPVTSLVTHTLTPPAE